MKRFEVGQIYKLSSVTANFEYYFRVVKRNKKSVRLIEVESNGSEIPDEIPVTIKLFEDICEYVLVPGIEIDGSRDCLSAFDECAFRCGE